MVILVLSQNTNCKRIKRQNSIFSLLQLYKNRWGMRMPLELISTLKQLFVKLLSCRPKANEEEAKWKRKSFPEVANKLLISPKHAGISSSYFSRDNAKNQFFIRKIINARQISTPWDDITLMCSQFYSRRFFPISIKSRERIKRPKRNFCCAIKRFKVNCEFQQIFLLYLFSFSSFHSFILWGDGFWTKHFMLRAKRGRWR